MHLASLSASLPPPSSSPLSICVTLENQHTDVSYRNTIWEQILLLWPSLIPPLKAELHSLLWIYSCIEVAWQRCRRERLCWGKQKLKTESGILLILWHFKNATLSIWKRVKKDHSTLACSWLALLSIRLFALYVIFQMTKNVTDNVVNVIHLRRI